MNQPAHTPGQMTYGHLGMDALWFGPDHESKPVAIIPWDCDKAREEASANAAEMRRRWNAHDDLVEALKEARAWIVLDRAPLSKAHLVPMMDAALEQVKP